MLGMHGTAYANYAVEDCDFLLALGARFDDRVAGVPDKFAPAREVHRASDIDPAEIGKVRHVDWHHLGDLSRALRSPARVRPGQCGRVDTHGTVRRMACAHRRARSATTR